jgi:RHS repeat-associated protein
VFTNTCAQNYKFTGLERDAESGLDKTVNRMYTSNLGRWLSPDPRGGVLSDPQSLNRYAYTLNNPTSFVDALGLGPCVPGAPGYEDDCPPPDDGGVPSGGGGLGGGTPFSPLQDDPSGTPGGSCGTNNSGFVKSVNKLREAANYWAGKKTFKKPCEADFGMVGVTDDQVRQAASNATFLK